PGAVRARPAPHRRGAVQGVRPGAAGRRRDRPAPAGRAEHQGRSVTQVAVLDYGSGNIRSAERALVRAGADVTVTSDFDTALNADGLFVPGVGAFSACMAGLGAGRGGGGVDE